MSEKVNTENFGTVNYCDFATTSTGNASTWFKGNNSNTWEQLTDRRTEWQPKQTAYPNLEVNKKMEVKTKRPGRGLYNVILIDPKESKVFLDKKVISNSIDDVLLEVDASSAIKEAKLSVSDVDKIVIFLGEVRKTRKNKTGEVEIIEEETKE